MDKPITDATVNMILQTSAFFLASLFVFLSVPRPCLGQSGKNEPTVLQMPDYQYPPQAVSKENAVNWRWMKNFNEREVSGKLKNV